MKAVPVCVALTYVALWCSTRAAIDSNPQAVCVFKRLHQAISQIRLIDTHEHLSNESDFLQQPSDVLASMLHYLEDDLIASGLPKEKVLDKVGSLKDATIPIVQRWELFMQYWPNVKLTSYARALRRAILDLYGMDIDQIGPKDAIELNQRIKEARKPGFYRWILKEKAGIELAIVDIGRTDVDREFFVPVLRFDRFVQVRSGEQIKKLCEEFGVELKDLASYVEALDRAVARALRAGIVGIKSALAYSRQIAYPMPELPQVESTFQKLIAGQRIPEAELVNLENYMMHKLCDIAGKYNLPFQIHTGLHAGNRKNITHSKPTDLISLIERHPHVQFILFHGGYPYGHELGVMAKNFPNVYIDMCWLHIISEKSAQEYLEEWMRIVPINKILGFGGDYLYPEGSYAHAFMARENITSVLTRQVIQQTITEEEAFQIAQKLLRENALDLFKLHPLLNK